MTLEHTSQVVGTSFATTTGLLIGLPNPISAALYALIAAVVGWITTYLLNLVKKKLGL